jgi:phage terminase small subunit
MAKTKPEGPNESRNEEGLTWIEAAFVRAYVTMLINNGHKANGRECAIAAGCPKTSASSRSTQFLKTPAVKAAIEKRMNEHLSAFDVTAEKVVAEIAKLAFSNMKNYIQPDGKGSFFVDFSALTDDQAAALAEVTIDEYTEGKGDAAENLRKIKFKLHDKKGSLDLLGRWLKLWTEKVELTGKDGSALPAPIFQVQFVDAEDGKPK